MKEFRNFLIDTWEQKTSLLCFGMDPVVERMKIDKSKNLSDEIVNYFSRIMKEILLKITAVKPNLGFYLQYGNEGINALIRLIEEAKKNEVPVILDGKFGDIGRTSEAYAKFAFEIAGADAVTLNPYMGYDALMPFLNYKDKGFYILGLTSNPGAKDFQYLDVNNSEKLYDRVIESALKWNKENSGVGAVIGATHKEIKRILENLSRIENHFPLLIPGVGTQGGSYKELNEILNKLNYKKGVVRINSSSAISYAHENFSGFSYTEAAYLAVEKIMKS